MSITKYYILIQYFKTQSIEKIPEKRIRTKSKTKKCVWHTDVNSATLDKHSLTN